MQKQKSETSLFEDGFESEDQDKTDLIKLHPEELNEQRLQLQQHMIKYIPPPQEIKAKSYSLHPDIITGWAPKIVLPKPIPLTFPFQPLSRILKAYEKIKNDEVKLKYLGPRFDNTYSAWKSLITEFPYQHLGERKVIITDRKCELKNPRSTASQVNFDSLFESGNLDAVFQVGQFEYDCFMRVDTNTKGHLQWFYFKMQNLKPKESYRIHICNFQKSKTLYLRGMKPYVFSSSQYRRSGIGWHQRGQNVEYCKKISKTEKVLLFDENDQSQCQGKQAKYFTLSFTISVGNEPQCLEIAYCQPYTWTKLMSFLQQVNKHNKNRDIIVQGQLCLSLGGFKVPLLTVTSQASQTQSQFKKHNPFKNKSLIFISGRIHPGESNGSYMMQGFINWICGHSAQAQELRSRYIFKIVPMVNPDGVIIGNYRTGLSGKDFNREFTQPDPLWFVQISQLKHYLQRCKWIYQKRFKFFLDFHGHTVKKNIFAYGPEFPITHAKYYECRLFPKLLARKTQLFRYYSCVFKVAPAKATTARAILLREYGIPFTYTLQASNGCFYDQQTNKDVPFDSDKWLLTGQKVGQTFYEYWKIIYKIQMESMRRKKEKQQRQKNKWQKVKRIQSSKEKRYQKSSTSNKKSTIRVQQMIKSDLNQNIYSDILNELKNQKQEESKKNSDDELSQGKSDSENQEDDIEATALKSFLLGAKKPNKKLEIIKNMHNQQKKQKQEKLITLIKKSSFITELQQMPIQNDRQRYSPIEKRKRESNYRKKIYTVSSIPSPNREQDINNPKIINLSFLLNPIPIASTMVGLPDRRNRRKTEGSEYQNQNSQTLKQQNTESFRRTYLSLQRQALKKDLIKRISMYGRPLSKQAFKVNEVVGKRIFNQS